jgi:hypothetical protein
LRSLPAEHVGLGGEELAQFCRMIASVEFGES